MCTSPIVQLINHPDTIITEIQIQLRGVRPQQNSVIHRNVIMLDYIARSMYKINFLGLLLLICCVTYVLGLKCWSCIGDDCDLNPSTLDKASPHQCQEYESCQKVYFKAKDPEEEVYYESTVRSCSVGHCQTRDDFHNCSNVKLENPGCMKRFCCDIGDLCNAAQVLVPGGVNNLILWVIGILTVLIMGKVV